MCHVKSVLSESLFRDAERLEHSTNCLQHAWRHALVGCEKLILAIDVPTRRMRSRVQRARYEDNKRRNKSKHNVSEESQGALKGREEREGAGLSASRHDSLCRRANVRQRDFAVDILKVLGFIRIRLRNKWEDNPAKHVTLSLCLLNIREACCYHDGTRNTAHTHTHTSCRVISSLVI